MLIIPLTFNSILVTFSTPMSKAIFLHSNFFLVWFFFVVYIFSVITYGFFMSILFKKSTASTTVGSLLFFIMIAVYITLASKFYKYSSFIKALLSMLVNVNMSIGVDLLLNRESLDEGINFSNLFEPDIHMRFSFGQLLIYMTIGSALMMLLTMYIERVLPGQFGIAESWYFPVNFLIEKLKKPQNENYELEELNGVNEGDFEDEPADLKVGIKIDKVRKKFGAKVAVNNLSLNMFESQTTVLLGE